MLKLLKEFKKKDWLLVLCATFFIGLGVYFDLKLPDYMSQITKLVQTEGTNTSLIINQGKYMLICAVLSMVTTICTGYFTAWISARLSYNIREKIYNKVMSFGLGEIKNFSTSSLITRTTNDISNIQMFMSMGLLVIIKSPITAVWAIVKILNKGYEWSILTGVVVIILLTCVTTLITLVSPKFKIIQNLVDKLNNLTREHLIGIRVVHAFNAENYQTNKFNDSNKELTDVRLFADRMMSLMSPIMYLMMHSLTLGIYIIGAILINKSGNIDKLTTFSNMVVFSSYAMQVVMSFLMMSMIFTMYPRTSISSKRILEVINTNSSIKDGNGKVNTKGFGTLEFKHVYFKYPDANKYILEDINFKIDGGKTFAFIGATGSGKTTIVNLIFRFYDVTKGEILLDGVNIKDYKLEDLHNKLGYAPQKATLFSRSVKENIAYGNDIIEDKVNKAIKISQAKNFVDKMENNIDSIIARGGTNISGGQKQRLNIARSIYKDAEIYVFDDCFSALDYKTDYKLRKELKNNIKDSSIIIVAQRVGTIMEADNIIVLDEGKIVGQGKHKELLKNCDIYKEIAYSQLSKEELA